MTSMPQCCKFCGAFQDKVYSISGKDKRFPALFKAWRYRKQDAKQYERWKGIVGKENMPKDLDSFQDLKYNKNKKAEFSVFVHYKYARETGDLSAFVGFTLYAKGKSDVTINPDTGELIQCNKISK